MTGQSHFINERKPFSETSRSGQKTHLDGTPEVKDRLRHVLTRRCVPTLEHGLSNRYIEHVPKHML